MSVTIRDIAIACGVSEGTVDRALNHRAGIRAETKERILEAARRMDYRPNQVAQSLATGSSKTICILCLDLYNNFLAVLVDVIEAAAKEKGYFVNLILTHGDLKKEEEGLDYLYERRADGVILFPVGQGNEYVEKLNRLEIPVVTIYNRISPKFVHVDVDARQIMRNAVTYLVRRGYERPVFVNARMREKQEKGHNVYTLKERQEGYLEGVEREGLGTPVILEGIEEDTILELVKETEKRLAFLCISDAYALEILNICRKNRIGVPEQVGIMGYDNMEMLRYVQPRITTVEYDVEAMGREAFGCLYCQIQGEDVEEEPVLSYRFIEGETL